MWTSSCLCLPQDGIDHHGVSLRRSRKQTDQPTHTHKRTNTTHKHTHTHTLEDPMSTHLTWNCTENTIPLSNVFCIYMGQFLNKLDNGSYLSRLSQRSAENGPAGSDEFRGDPGPTNRTEQGAIRNKNSTNSIELELTLI